MSTKTRDSPEKASPRGRYFVRTWICGVLPGRLTTLVPKGRQDCGAHEFYNHDDAIDLCYHCVGGERPHALAPLGREAQTMLERSARVGSAAAGRILADRR